MSDIGFTRYSGLILKHNLDVVKREIVLSGSVSHKMLSRLDKHLKILEIQPEAITIVVNTGGGDIEAALGIVDRIRLSPCHITTIGTGIVMSAGIPILSSGASRKATKYTRFMYHCPGLSMSFHRLTNVDAEVKYTKELGRIMDKLLAENTKKNYIFWSGLGKHVDYNFNAEQALEFGLIDEIL